MVYSLDFKMLFDPFELELDITPDSIRKVLSTKSDFGKALLMAIKLNENDLMREVIEQIPLNETNLVRKKICLKKSNFSPLKICF